MSLQSTRTRIISEMTKSLTSVVKRTISHGALGVGCQVWLVMVGSSLVKDSTDLLLGT